MRTVFRRWMTISGAVVICCGVSSWSLAQRANVDAQGKVSQSADSVGIEVLMRGPVHEGFAEPASNASTDVESLRLPEPIPDAIDEQPAAARPVEGNRQSVWIPGYWGLEDEGQVCWVSGTWRFAPPGMRWVPGYWASVDDGSQWVPGFWASNEVEEVDYLPPPPEPEPYQPPQQVAENQFWVPGHYHWENGDYVWHDGFWAETNPDWVWVPASYVATPRGYIHVPGYWDYPLERRGTLFAPVRFQQVNSRYSYRPQVAINMGQALVHWFVHPSYGQYYFGNYYGSDYASFGLQPWAAYSQAQTTYYDPLYTYYSHSRNDYLQGLVTSHQRLSTSGIADLPIFYNQYEQWARANANLLTQGPLANTVDQLLAGGQRNGSQRFENLTDFNAAGGNQQFAELRQQVDSIRRFAQGRRDVETGQNADANVGANANSNAQGRRTADGENPSAQNRNEGAVGAKADPNMQADAKGQVDAKTRGGADGANAGAKADANAQADSTRNKDANDKEANVQTGADGKADAKVRPGAAGKTDAKMQAEAGGKVDAKVQPDAAGNLNAGAKGSVDNNDKQPRNAGERARDAAQQGADRARQGAERGQQAARNRLDMRPFNQNRPNAAVRGESNAQGGAAGSVNPPPPLNNSGRAGGQAGARGQGNLRGNSNGNTRGRAGAQGRAQGASGAQRSVEGVPGGDAAPRRGGRGGGAQDGAAAAGAGAKEPARATLNGAAGGNAAGNRAPRNAPPAAAAPSGAAPGSAAPAAAPSGPAQGSPAPAAAPSGPAQGSPAPAAAPSGGSVPEAAGDAVGGAATGDTPAVGGILGGE